MRPAVSRLAGWTSGVVSIGLGVFNWLWIFYASEASLHMGSPIRRHSKHAVASMSGDQAYVARDSHGAGLVLIDVLGDTLYVMFASGAFLMLAGVLLIYFSSYAGRRPQTLPAAAPDGPSRV